VAIGWCYCVIYSDNGEEKKMRLKMDYKIPALVLLFVAVILFFIYGGERAGLPTDTANTFIMCLPGLVILGVAAMCLPRGDIWTAGGFIGIGIGFAILIGAAYGQGIVSDQMLTGLTIEEEQILIVVVMAALGLLSMARERWF